eukprot:3002827-Rhodomonas_salina.1
MSRFRRQDNTFPVHFVLGSQYTFYTLFWVPSTRETGQALLSSLIPPGRGKEAGRPAVENQSDPLGCKLQKPVTETEEEKRMCKSAFPNRWNACRFSQRAGERVQREGAREGRERME